MSLLEKLKRDILHNKIVKSGDKIVVGVSGGPDSVFLLHFLNHLSHELGLKLCVAHLNHKLRKSADTDERFVIKLASHLALPCATGAVHLKKRRGSVEEVARQARLKFLIGCARKFRTKTIALAHTQDDLAETVLMRILRGTGLYGLQGMLPERDIYSFTFIRPLLHITRAEIIKFLKQNGIAYRFDPTNKEKKFFRNKIRLRLIPILEKQYHKAIKKTLANLSRTAGADYDYLEKEGRSAFKKVLKESKKTNTVEIRLSEFCRLHSAMQRMILRLSIEKLKNDTRRLTLSHLREIEDLVENRPVGSAVHLPQGITAVKNSDTLVVRIPKKPINTLYFR